MNTFKFQNALVLSVLLLPCISQAVIIEIAYLHEIFTHLMPGATVIFDIDNTLTESAHPEQLGSDQWFYAYWQHLIHQGLDSDRAFHEALCLYWHHELAIKAQCVEPSTAQVVQAVTENHTVMGLTSRSMVLMQKTIDNLLTLGINFASKLHHRGFMVDTHHPAFLYHGIIFCSGYSKGKVLKQFFEVIGHRPANIVMIDDKRSSLESVEAVCQELSIEFIGLRYGHLDEKVLAYVL